MSTIKKNFKKIFGFNNSFAHAAAFFTACFVGLIIVSCTKPSDNSAQNAKKDSNESEVNLTIWGNYLSPELIKKFETETGITIHVSNYTSNEELLAKVQAGGSGVDVAVPSDYMVAIMTKLGLLSSLDKAKIPNLKQVSPDVLKKNFDPENNFSLPYAWSTAGIAINRDLFKGEIKSWKDIFNNPKLAGKISLLDDVREVTAAALKMNGYSVNTTNLSELKKAEDSLLKLKPKIKMFRSDTVEVLLSKQVAVAQAYSSDALQAAAQSGSHIEFILPEEGGTRAIDALVILKGAPHPEAAHKLINFMLSKDVNVEFVKTMWGGPVLSTTRESLPESIRTNQALFPSPEKLARFESIEDLGEKTKLYDDLWTKVKTE